MSAVTSDSEAVSPPLLAPAAHFIRDRTTWLNYTACFYLLVIQASLGPAMPFVREDRGLNYTVAGLHFTAVAFGALLSGLFGSLLVPRLGRQRTFWLGLTGITLGGLLFVLSAAAPLSILGATLIGLLGSLMVIVVQANLAERHSAHRAVAMVEINLACSAGTILAAFGVGLAERTPVGWPLAFLAPMVVCLLVTLRFRSSSIASPPLPGATHRSHGPLPKVFWVLCAAGALSAAAEWSIGYWSADFLNGSAGASKSGAAAMLSLFFIGMTAGRLAGIRLIRHHHPERLLVVALGIAVIGFPVFWLAPTTPIRLSGLLVLGLGIANVYPMIAALATTLLPRMLDVAFARLQATSAVMILSAPLVLGIFGDEFGIKTAMAIIVPLLIGALALAIWVSRNLMVSTGAEAARRGIG